MTRNSALITLIDLAQKASDEQAKHLGDAIRYVDQAREKLRQLQQYLTDYQSRLQTEMQGGMTPIIYQNYQSFLNKLETAIRTQENDIVYAQSVVEQRKQALADCEKKRLSYSTLHKRNVKEAEKKAEKKEQKTMDEYASRISSTNKEY